MLEKQRFDDWPERYDRWFETPAGKAVLKYECELILELLLPGKRERILDVGSGTGIFTREFLDRGVGGCRPRHLAGDARVRGGESHPSTGSG